MRHVLLALVLATPSSWTQEIGGGPPQTSRSNPGVSTAVDGTTLLFGELATVLRPVLAEYEGVPGMGCALIVDGELVGRGAAGVRAAGSDEHVTTDDLWHLGSCTKAMTAALVMRLVEREQLSLEAKLSGAYEDLEVHADLADVTLVELLTHRAGLTNTFTPDKVGDLWLQLRLKTGDPRGSRDLLVAEILPLAPDFEPGTSMSYSNTGYVVAGDWAERATGKDWEVLMAEHVFGPLEMTSAGFGAPGVGEEGITQPRGHSAGGKPLKPGPIADNPSALGPAGTVHASLEDWARFVIAVMGPGPVSHGAASRGAGERGAGAYLAPESLAQLRAVPPANFATEYGLGWVVTRRPWAKGPVLTHSGSNTYWFCTAWVVPEEGFALLVTANSASPEAQSAVDAACVALLRHAGRLDPLPPKSGAEAGAEAAHKD